MGPPRPSPVDLQYEDEIWHGASYDGSSIVEWNIDGLSEYQILRVVKNMLIYASACKTRHNDDRQIANAIIAGFTGQLQGWWDHFLTAIQKNVILQSVRQTDSGEVYPDVVNALVYTILLHFVGSTQIQVSRSQEQLLNLRCPTLSHFKWYKDVFLSKVLAREDCNQDFWKEKFLSGFPPLFAERVRSKLRAKHNGNIPFSHYTYGELAAEVVTEGLALCNDVK